MGAHTMPTTQRSLALAVIACCLRLARQLRINANQTSAMAHGMIS